MDLFALYIFMSAVLRRRSQSFPLAVAVPTLSLTGTVLFPALTEILVEASATRLRISAAPASSV